MLKKIALATLMASAFSVTAATQDPFSVYPFKVPEQYQETLKDYRSKWQRVTGFEYSGLHWQQFIAVFINQDAKVYENNYSEYLRFYQDYDEDEDEEDVAEPNFKAYQVGTVVLKENFSSLSGKPDQPLTVTMMVKREPGYDADNGDWEYVQFDKNGQILLQGNSKKPEVDRMCASCHVNIANRDYIFANFYSRVKAH